jgi:hypothetical protein
MKLRMINDDITLENDETVKEANESVEYEMDEKSLRS